MSRTFLQQQFSKATRKETVNTMKYHHIILAQDAPLNYDMLRFKKNTNSVLFPVNRSVTS